LPKRLVLWAPSKACATLLSHSSESVCRRQAGRAAPSTGGMAWVARESTVPGRLPAKSVGFERSVPECYRPTYLSRGATTMMTEAEALWALVAGLVALPVMLYELWRLSHPRLRWAS